MYGNPYGHRYFPYAMNYGIGDPNTTPGLWLVVTTVNAVTGVPLIEHKFYGRTQEEANARYVTHMAADAFLRACGDYDTSKPHDYNGTPCRSTWRWEPAR